MLWVLQYFCIFYAAIFAADPPRLVNQDPYERIREETKVINPDSQEGKAFQKYMERQFLRLYPKHDFRMHPIQFWLSEDPFGTYFYGGEKGVVVALSIKELKEAESVDELLAPIAHESVHRKFYERFGKHPNSKWEELKADLAPIDHYLDVGLNPEAILKSAERSFTQRPSFSQIVDVHPTDQNRKRLIRDKLAAARLTRGTFPPSTPLDKNELKPFLEAKHKSWLAGVMDALAPKPVTPLQQLTFLEKVIFETPYWNAARILNVRQEMRKIQIDRTVPELAALQDRIANRLHTLPDRNAASAFLISLGGTVVKWKPEESHRERLAEVTTSHPLGDLLKLDLLFYRFIKAKDRETAQAISQEIRELTQTLEPQLRFLRQNNLKIHWNQFRFPKRSVYVRNKDGDGTSVPWGAHFQWADLDARGDITHTLLLMNVDSEPLRRIGQSKAEFLPRAIYPLMPPPNHEGFVPLDLAWDELTGEIEKYPKEPRVTNGQSRDGVNLNGAYFFKAPPLNEDQIERLFKELESHIVARQGKKVKAEQNDNGLGDVFERLVRELEQSELHFEFGLKWMSKYPNAYAKLHLNYAIRTERSGGKTSLGFQGSHSMLVRTLTDIFSGTNSLTPELKDHLLSSADLIYLIETFDRRNDFQNSSKKTGSFHFLTVPPNSLVLQKNQFTPEEKKRYLDRLSRQGVFSGLESLELDSATIDVLSRLYEVDFALTRENLLRLAPQLAAHSEFRKELWQLYIHRTFLKAPQNFRSEDLVPLLLSTQGLLAGTIRHEATPTSERNRMDYSQEMKRSERDFVRHLEDLAEKLSLPDIDAKSLVQFLTRANETSLFKIGSSKRTELLEWAVKKVEAIPSLDAKIALFGELLPLLQSDSVILRDKVKEILLNELHHKYGIDTHQQDFADRLILELTKATKAFDPVLKREFMAEIGKRVEAQRPLAYRLERLGIPKEKELMDRSHFVGPMMESLLHFIKYDVEFRKTTTNLLLSAGTPADLSQFSAVLRDNILIFGQNTNFSHDVLALAREGEKEFEPFGTKQALLLYQSYWRLPFEARAAAIEQLLFPTDSPTDQEFHQRANFILDRLFPEGEPHSKEGKLFLRAYIDVLPSYQRSIFLAATLVATQKKNESELRGQKLGLGERLAILLELMGPAETKAGQGGHSHPNTPIDIKEGLSRLKYMADPPPRWELLKLHTQQVPLEVRNNIVHVGKILGTGSYYLVYEVTLQDGKQAVLAVLRPHALERAENGFENLDKMLEKLATEIAANDLQTLREIIEDAKARAKVEASSRKAAELMDAARPSYEGAQVKVGDKIYTFHVPRLLKYGKNYRLMEKAPGNHFLDNKNVDPQEKKDLAKAVLTFELYQILKGGRFDKDRHGAQMRIEGRDIHMFDFGAYTEQEPTVDERKQLGRVLEEGVAFLIAGRPLDKVIQELVKKERDAGKPTHYLSAVQEALLKLYDYYSIVPESLVESISAVFETGRVHPDIGLRLQPRVGMLKLFMRCSIIIQNAR